jgi:hypothetical protein
MLFIRSSWEHYRGQTEWINGPGSGIRHTVCGNEIEVFTQFRTIWEDGPGPCASDGQERVSILQCVKCHGEPKLVNSGSPICRENLIDVPT